MTISARLVSRHLSLIARAIRSSAIECLDWAFATTSKLSRFTVSIHSVGPAMYWIVLFDVKSK